MPPGYYWTCGLSGIGVAHEIGHGVETLLSYVGLTADSDTPQKAPKKYGFSWTIPAESPVMATASSLIALAPPGPVSPSVVS